VVSVGMRRQSGLLVCFLLIVSSNAEHCEKWSWEDQINHECRSCRDITIDRFTNCPQTGYTCDENEPISATVLNPSDACSCQSLRCANIGWSLAVNGTIADKVRCKGGQWTTSKLVAPSFVCAKPDAGIPAMPPATPSCPSWRAATPQECNMQSLCSTTVKATITPSMMSCPPNFQIQLLGGGSGAGQYKVMKCLAPGAWYGDNQDGSDPILADDPEGSLAQPIVVGCRMVGGG
ncbi:hypothetical protein PENTCL1PPCAC_14559, partial [Pristionchus entomophagus]